MSLTVGLGIPTGLVALRCTSVVIQTPFSIEGSQVPVLLPDPHAVVPVLCIKDRVLGVVGDGHGLPEWGLGWVALSHTHVVELLQVRYASCR